MQLLQLEQARFLYYFWDSSAEVLTQVRDAGKICLSAQSWAVSRHVALPFILQVARLVSRHVALPRSIPGGLPTCRNTSCRDSQSFLLPLRTNLNIALLLLTLAFISLQFSLIPSLTKSITEYLTLCISILFYSSAKDKQFLAARSLFRLYSHVESIDRKINDPSAGRTLDACLGLYLTTQAAC